MLTTYTVLKTIHVLAAAAWVGGGLILVILISRARRAADSGTLVAMIEGVRFVGPRIFATSSLILVITGIWLVLDGDLSWDLWVILGLIGWAATFVTGNFFLRPASDRIGEALEQRGPEDPETRRYVDTILNVARVDQVVLALVIVDMVIKPG